MEVYLLLALIGLLLIFSFLNTRFRSYSIGSVGGLFGLFLLIEAAKEKGPAPHTMAGMAQGLGAAYLFAVLLILFLAYGIILSIQSWQLFRRQKKAGAAQIKKGLYYSNGIMLLCFIISFLNIPLRIIENRRLSKAKSDFYNTYQLLTDSIKADSNNYRLYYKRAAITGHFIDTNTAYSYPFGNDADKLNDIKKAFALQQDDYLFLTALSNLLPYDVDYMNNKGKSIKTVMPAAAIDPENKIWDSIGLAIGKKANALLFDSLQRQIAQYPQSGKWYFERGALFKKMGDTTKAMADFEILNQLAPKNDYGTEKELAEFYLRKGATDKCNTYFRKYIGEAVFKEGPFNFLSERAALKEEIAPKEAIVDYKAALVLQPNDFGTRNKIMDLFLKMGDSSNAGNYSK